MHYKSFRIKNFKGIKDTTVSLETLVGANVFAFVGLNESGKTTILEAIHSFAPEEATSQLLSTEVGIGVPFRDRVPRHLLSDFSGDVTVTAKISVSDADWIEINRHLQSTSDLELNLSKTYPEVILERLQRFKSGDLLNNFFSLKTQLEVKNRKQRVWRKLEVVAEKQLVRDAIYKLVPKIAYFPTFVFNFPKSIFLTDRGTVVDKFYRRVFQDILDYDGRNQTIEEDIVRRIRKKEMIIPWPTFFSKWALHDDKEKIQQVMDRASAAVSRLVFGRWNKIFGEDVRGKEILIQYEIVEGEVEDAKGTKSATLEHDIFVKFQIKDGTRRYDVNDRSLGFRWFFCFMLFTQFRAARTASGAEPIVFLFDEPAANLHAAAQQKLIESFPEIARNGHVLVYTTHSHYMIEPKWLEQTYIVTNRSDSPPNSILDEISLDDESLDIKAATYRDFVDKHPSSTNYFQPILDRLEVVPSRFDIKIPSVVVEGKSDYYILRYAAALTGYPDLHLIPGLGAPTLASMASLQVGWNLNFVFLLDGDKAGNDQRDKFITELGMSSDKLVLLNNLDPEYSQIEELLDSEANKAIQKRLGLSSEPSKSQIRRFFQEQLASNRIESLGAGFELNARRVLDALSSKLNGGN